MVYNNLLLQVNFSVDVIDDPIEISQPNGDPVVFENTPSSSSFLLTNNGESNVSLSEMTFTGSDAANFENLSPTSVTIAPGESKLLTYDSNTIRRQLHGAHRGAGFNRPNQRNAPMARHLR